MKAEYEILKLRVLLHFINSDKEDWSVIKISRTLDVTKQRVSRILMDLEKEGFADRSDCRHPILTEKGIELAKWYEERIRVSLSHLLFEGVPLKQAEEDAFHWAIFNTDETMKVIREAEAKYRVKYLLRNKPRFSGAELCRQLGDGIYDFNFVIYREEVKKGSNISMANDGFEHPGYLEVKNGVGKIKIRAIDMKSKSPITNEKIDGKVDSIKYYFNGEFISADTTNDIITFPAETLQFINIGTGINQILHGSVYIKIRCTVYPVHMPESLAVFTIIL